MSRRAVMAVMVAGGAAVTPAHAQSAAGIDPRVLAHGRMHVGLGSENETTGLTPAEKKQASAVLDAIVAVLEKFPEIATPHGYDVDIQRAVVAPGVTTDSGFGLVKMDVGAILRWYYVNENVSEPTRVPETPFWPQIEVNDPSCVFRIAPNTDLTVDPRFRGRPDSLIRHGAEIRVSDRIDPRQSKFFENGPAVWNDCVLLTHINRPLWVPVSRQQYLESAISRWEQDLRKQSRANNSNRIKPDEYRRWLADRPARLAEVEKNYRTMKASDPQGAEKYKRESAEVEAFSDSTYRAQLADAGTDNAVPDRLRDLRAELAALSAAERASPAYLCGPGSKRSSELCNMGDGGARQVVMANPKLFDRTLPITAPQIITIDAYNAPDDPPNPDPTFARLNSLVNRIRETLDRPALGGLLRP